MVTSWPIIGAYPPAKNYGGHMPRACVVYGNKPSTRSAELYSVAIIRGLGAFAPNGGRAYRTERSLLLEWRSTCTWSYLIPEPLIPKF